MSELFEQIKAISAAGAAPHIEAGLRARIAKLEEALAEYVLAYPVFRSKPIGAPGSLARNDQDALIALQDKARAALGESK
jgi:hypothetical protein